MAQLKSGSTAGGKVIATQDWVTSTIVDGAPSALNTLNELAAAIGDNSSYAASITTALGGKLSTTGKAADSDKLDGYHASSFWRNGVSNTWTPSTNILLPQSANSQEWSFDITRNGYSGGYWQVWDSSNSTMLKVDAVSGKVSAPYGFVGNLQGNITGSAASATTAGSATTATTATNLGPDYTADDWFRATGDNNPVKFYGGSTQMTFRTDGVTEAYSGIGGYPFVWTYAGSSSAQRIMLLSTTGRIWSNVHGWLDEAFQAAGSYASASHNHDAVYLGITSKAADSNLLDGYDSSAFIRENQDRRHKVIRFTGEGGNSGNSSMLPYAIYQEGGAWTHPYPNLRINMHTGMSFGANSGYGGYRFMSDYNTNNIIFSVNDGDANVRVTNNLYIGSAGGWITDLLNAKETAGAADAVNTRIDTDVLPAIPTNNNQLTNGAGYITDGNTGWNNTYGFITNNISTGITINGSLSRGTYTTASNYATGADNIVLKGNSAGRSGIFFESEKDGTNINHPSDFAYIQYHAYGTLTSGEANELRIGVSNDADDHIIFNAPNTNGMKFRVGAATTDYTVYHSGNLSLADLGYTGATNANYITNNNQLTNGAGYATTSYVNTAVANLVDSAPGTLNTLNELAAALGDDADFSTTIANNIGAVNYRIDEEVLPWIGSITLSNLNGLAVDGKAADSNLLDGIDSSGFVQTSGNQSITGTKTFSNGSIVIQGSHASISFIDDTSGADDFYLHANSNNFYVLSDRDGSNTVDGGYDSPHPMQLEADTNSAYFFGNKLNSAAYQASSAFDAAGSADAVQTWVGEQNFATDAAINTAIGTVTLASLGYTGATNANYITNNNQLTNGAGYITSADGGNAQTLDGIDSSSFLRSDADDTHSGTLALTAITAASGSIANTKGSYLHIGAWGTGRTAADAVLVNTAYRSDILSYTRSFTIGNTARNFNGSANVSWSLADIGAEAAGSAAAVDGRIDNEVLPAIPTNNNQLTNGAGYLTTTGKAADSNLLDGINSSSFLRSDANDTATGNLTFTGNARFDAALTVLNTVPAINLTESDANSDYAIRNNFGVFNIYDNTNLQNRLSIRSDGNVGIGKTNPSAKLDVEGAITASGDITAFSDARVKENVETIPNALEKVTALRGVNFNKIGEEKRSTGVIAQEVKEVFPEVIHENEDGMLSVAYGNITGVLIEAIKEQQKQIEELKAQLDGLTK